MGELYDGRVTCVNATKNYYSVSADKRTVADGEKKIPAAGESTYTSEPSLLDEFICFLSGMAYTGGSGFDANGQCQVKGKLIERNMRMR
ncbi:MAG: hypothetical protein WC683_11460 [bacterium]